MRVRRGGGTEDPAAASAAGRWLLLERTHAHAERPLQPEAHEHIETIALALLRRWGVLFKRLMDRETRLVPWRDLLYVLRRLEARGDICGGRFVDGFAGEQFALPEAVESLQALRRRRDDGELIVVSGVDPLNLSGAVVAGSAVQLPDDKRLSAQTFSPDGSTLFVNIQDPGITLAITGPWRTLDVPS